MRTTLLTIFWIFSDSILFVGGALFAYFVRVGWIFSSDLPLSRFLLATVLSVPPWIIMLGTTRVFAVTRKQASFKNITYIAYANLVGIALIALTHFFLFQHVFSRSLIAIAYGSITVGIITWHVVFEYIQRAVLRRSPPAYPLLLVGVTRESRAMLAHMQRLRSPLTPVAILDAAGVNESSIQGVPVLGKLNKLGDVLRDKKISHLLHCSDLEQSINLLSACRTAGVTYMVLPSVFGMVEGTERIDFLEGKAVTVVSPPAPLWHWFFR